MNTEMTIFPLMIFSYVEDFLMGNSHNENMCSVWHYYF